MSWLFGGGKKGGPGHNDARVARERQISNMHERIPGLQMKSQDNSLYEVQINVAGGSVVVLRVFLPTNFPAERPVLQLLSQVSHPWVNQYMQVVGHPDLNGWDATSPKLVGDIIVDVMQELRSAGSASQRQGQPLPQGQPMQQMSHSGGGQPGFPPHQPQGGYYHPGAVQGSGSAVGPGSVGLPYGGPAYGGAAHMPPPQQQQQAQVYGANPSGSSQYGAAARDGGGGNSPPLGSGSGGGGGGATAGPPVPAKRRDSVHHTPIPAIPTQFDELEEMPYVQLKRLLGDDVARRALLQVMPSVLVLKELRSDLREGNATVASSTLANEEKAKGLREEVEAAMRVLRGIKDEYQAKAQKHSAPSGGSTADQVILKKVKQASKQADNASEDIASQFLEGKMGHSDFLDSYLKERQRYHTLAAKIEGMKREIHF